MENAEQEDVKSVKLANNVNTAQGSIKAAANVSKGNDSSSQENLSFRLVMRS